MDKVIFVSWRLAIVAAVTALVIWVHNPFAEDGFGWFDGLLDLIGIGTVAYSLFTHNYQRKSWKEYMFYLNDSKHFGKRGLVTMLLLAFVVAFCIPLVVQAFVAMSVDESMDFDMEFHIMWVLGIFLGLVAVMFCVGYLDCCMIRKEGEEERTTLNIKLFNKKLNK